MWSMVLGKGVEQGNVHKCGTGYCAQVCSRVMCPIVDQGMLHNRREGCTRIEAGIGQNCEAWYCAKVCSRVYLQRHFCMVFSTSMEHCILPSVERGIQY